MGNLLNLVGDLEGHTQLGLHSALTAVELGDATTWERVRKRTWWLLSQAACLPPGSADNQL